MSSQDDISGSFRPLANFSPSVWGNHFLSSAPKLYNGGVQIREKIQHLKEEVRRMLLVAVEVPIEKLKLIDTIQRLGISYHFENEIEAILRDIHKNNTPFTNVNDEDGDLYIIALCFPLLRQQGYNNVSCGVFEKFKDDKGDFKKSLIGDVLGMLSLYEAAHLAIHGEDILDQAVAFTTFHLKSGLSDIRHDHKDKVVHALRWPLRKSIQRLTARWWKNLELAEKLPYARDKIVENYCFLLGAHFEPQYTIGRTITTTEMQKDPGSAPTLIPVPNRDCIHWYNKYDTCDPRCFRKLGTGINKIQGTGIYNIYDHC